MNIIDRFDNAIDFLYGRNQYLATEVTRLGYPILSKNVPTAGVSWDDVKNKIRFEFNEDFCKTLNDEEFAFVVAHEANHIINMHIFILQSEFEKLKKKNKSGAELSIYAQRFNIAADCVVNDSLTNLYNLNKMLYNDKKHLSKEDVESGKVFAIYGKETVGVNCENLSVLDVLSLMPEANVDYKTLDSHEWESFLDKNGNLKKEFQGKIKDFIERHLENSSLSDGESNQIDKMKDDFVDTIAKNSSVKAGDVPVGRFLPIVKESHCLNWDKLINNIVYTKFVEDRWNRQNRKLQCVYPDIILPKSDDREAKEIFLAIDSSGSIDMNALSLFVSVAKSSPKFFKIRAISFDTMCYDFDIRGEERPRGGGGTRFDIIEEYIANNLKKYPKAIVVLTDGEGGPVQPKHPERWCWLLYGTGSSHYCKNMKHFDLKKYLMGQK